MKIDKNKFIECKSYLLKINRTPLKNLDLSEFTNKDLTQEIEDWSFYGLNNTSFISELLEEL
jgi:hypothetical protein